MLAWTDREARTLQEDETARLVVKKGSRSAAERPACKSVELKAAVRSPGPGRPNSVCSSLSRVCRRECGPPLRSAVWHQKPPRNCSSQVSKQGDSIEAGCSLGEPMFTTSMCSAVIESTNLVPGSTGSGCVAPLSPRGVHRERRLITDSRPASPREGPRLNLTGG